MSSKDVAQGCLERMSERNVPQERVIMKKQGLEEEEFFNERNTIRVKSSNMRSSSGAD